MTEPTASTSGLRTFFTVWAGQLVSVTGSTMSAFAVQFWIYSETGSVTSLAMVSLAFALPSVLVSPVAGALVDRWDRRRVMFAADTVAAVATLSLALLYAADTLELWHVFTAVAVIGLSNAFQEPAWLASIPLLVPKAQLGRANGLVQLNQGVSLVLAPAMAGAVLVTAGLQAVLFIDVATFLVALTALAIVRIPRPEGHDTTSTGKLGADAALGWRFVRERPGLFGLLWIAAGVNFSLAFVNVLLIPLVVAFASEGAAGGVFSAAGIGLIAGSVVVSAWGGPKRRMRGIMSAIAVAGIFVALCGARPSVLLVAVCSVGLMAVVPVANTASQVLWQLKVPPAMQGRVFSIRRMISQGISPIAILLSGPLADRVFEPLLAEDGALAGSVGSVIGVGAGRGVGFMFIVTGVVVATLAAIGYLIPRIRNVETELPDYVADQPTADSQQPIAQTSQTDG
jgi:DHA3 family macrolide efflux protein-like MFS transporter